MRTLALLLISVLSLASSSAFAATLNVDGSGQLLGAFDVEVNGSLYNVEFRENLCSVLYDGCDEAADFPFQTAGEAVAASQALLDQVFLDGPLGNFDSDPSLTGFPPDPVLMPNFDGICGQLEFFPVCYVHTPYPASTGIGLEFAANGTPPYAGSVSNPGNWIVLESAGGDFLFGTGTDIFAVWTTVPEPSTTLLVGLGLAGLAARRR